MADRVVEPGLRRNDRVPAGDEACLPPSRAGFGLLCITAGPDPRTPRHLPAQRTLTTGRAPGRRRDRLPVPAGSPRVPGG
ncbi:hypothetical protein KCH_71380 [Kitasatospora cheerisanensis KCTC 2395]|uniref:Uncharacterized protein n=1 Tax=Kitasatospora cheerisanensis KCTC 2395 TaxID=1348663 RepID=A0A066YM77_9ACTN|nr:hypothetical protein KCH_71380 [Kitasatospora cheerisanensis KCTC 2395]